jgi:hypothetical protein
MKKLLIVVLLSFGTISLMSFATSDTELIKIEMSDKSEFDQGFEDGHCEGWKDVKGEYSVCPVTPVAPVPKVSQRSDSYKDGYNTGFKRGMRDARK